MGTLIGIVLMVIGIVAGFRTIKLGGKAVNKGFDKIEDWLDK